MRILVVDDDSDFTTVQCEWLEKEGYDAIGVLSERDARKRLAENGEEIGIALIDMYMEAQDSGLKLIKLIGERYPEIVPIVITGHADFENAARCMEEGCFSYIVKGETPPNVIRQTIKKATEYYQWRVSYSQLQNIMPRLKWGLEELRDGIEQISCTTQRIENELPLLDVQGGSEGFGLTEGRDPGGMC